MFQTSTHAISPTIFANPSIKSPKYKLESGRTSAVRTNLYLRSKSDPTAADIIWKLNWSGQDQVSNFDMNKILPNCKKFRETDSESRAKTLALFTNKAHCLLCKTHPTLISQINIEHLKNTFNFKSQQSNVIARSCAWSANKTCKMCNLEGTYNSQIFGFVICGRKNGY